MNAIHSQVLVYYMPPGAVVAASCKMPYTLLLPAPMVSCNTSTPGRTLISIWQNKTCLWLASLHLCYHHVCTNHRLRRICSTTSTQPGFLNHSGMYGVPLGDTNRCNRRVQLFHAVHVRVAETAALSSSSVSSAVGGQPCSARALLPESSRLQRCSVCTRQ